MKKTVLLALLPLAALVGYLLSKASWIGRTGINLFYTEYKLLKTWWKGGLVVLFVWMLLYLLQAFFIRRATLRQSLIYFGTSALVCMAGLLLTYHDFSSNFSHRLLGWKFHTGGYLFWAGWLLIIVQGFWEKRKQQAA